jgi:hypothetical protein
MASKQLKRVSKFAVPRVLLALPEDWEVAEQVLGPPDDPLEKVVGLIDKFDEAEKFSKIAKGLGRDDAAVREAETMAETYFEIESRLENENFLDAWMQYHGSEAEARFFFKDLQDDILECLS